MQFMSNFPFYYRGWITLPASLKRKEISIKASQVLRNANSFSIGILA